MRNPAEEREPAAPDTDADQPRLVDKLDSIRPDGSSELPINPDEVTDILDLAFGRLEDAVASAGDLLSSATQSLAETNAATRALAKRLTIPPKRSDPER